MLPLIQLIKVIRMKADVISFEVLQLIKVKSELLSLQDPIKHFVLVDLRL